MDALIERRPDAYAQVGSFGGKEFDLKLTSAYPGGDDADCKSDADEGCTPGIDANCQPRCAIVINSMAVQGAAVDFFIKVHGEKREGACVPASQLREP